MLASLEGGCEVIEEPWGVLVVNPEFHLVHMANFLWLRELPSGGVEDALRRADELFRPYTIRHRTVFVEDARLAERLSPVLSALGFTAKPSHVMVARRPSEIVANPDVALRPARDQATRDDHDAIAGLLHEEQGYDHEVSHQLLSLQWRRVAALGREVYVGYLGGEPAGNVALDDLGGVGLVQQVETAPEMRRRGVAATMGLAMRQRADDKGLEPLALETPVADTTWEMYERLGFDRIGRLYEFLRTTP